MDWRNIPHIFRDMGDVDNVVGLGRGYKWVRGENTGQEAALVLVKKKFPRDDLRRAALLPEEIAGVPTDVIDVGDIWLLTAYAEYHTLGVWYQKAYSYAKGLRPRIRMYFNTRQQYMKDYKNEVAV